MSVGNHVIYAETITLSYLCRLDWLTILSKTCPSIKNKSRFSKRERGKEGLTRMISDYKFPDPVWSSG